MKPYFEINPQSKTVNLLIPIAVILISIAFGIGLYSNSSLLRKMDHFFYDTFMRTFDSIEVSDEITIIDIDETSLAAVGQWPWPRYRMADLIKKIYEYHPKATGVDIFFPEPDRSSLIQIKEQFQTDFDLKLGFTGVPSSLSDNDRYLAHVFKESKVVGARYFYFDHVNKKGNCKYNPVAITDHSGLLNLHTATGMLCNTSQIEDSLESTGFTNTRPDEDGILRQTPLLLKFNGKIYTHLSFSVFLKANGINQAQVLKDFYGIYIKAGQYKIPITRNGYVRMRFNGPTGKHTFISAVDIFNHHFSASDIRDKIILIGSSAVGLNDLHHTIYDSQFPGVETHAVIINNILNHQQISQPTWARKVLFGICILTGLMMAFLLQNTVAPRTLMLGTVSWVCLVSMSSILAYTKLSIFLSPGLPVLISVVLFSVFSFIRFAIARQVSFMWFKKLASSQQLTMEAMVSMVETRDPETGQHIKRTQYYARALSLYLKSIGQYSDQLTDTFIEILFISVPLHDIGKVGIPDRILLKPGKLTTDEFDLMKLHASYGRDTIGRVADKIKGDNYLKTGAEIAGSHHERWDGKGYPNSLSKEEIPLSGRIMAICDVYDALISRRCYKLPFSHEKSMNIIREGKGTVFDPVIVDAFFEIEDEIKSIATKFKDGIEEAPEDMKEIFMGRP